MRPHELKAALAADGWKFAPSLGPTGVEWYAYNRAEGFRDCECNDKPPSVIVTPYELSGDLAYTSVEISVTGEVRGQWLQLKAYSVPMEKLMETLPEAIDMLRAAWNAAVGSGK